MTSHVARTAAAIALLLVAGCAGSGGGRSAGASPAQVAACRQRSEDIYRQQNRGAIYTNDTYATSTRDSPFGGLASSSGGQASLGEQFGRERALNDCYNYGTNPSDTSPVTVPKP